MTAIYMKIPHVNGDVTNKNYSNWIGVDFIHFDVERNLDMKVGKVTERWNSLPSFNEVTVIKALDKASNRLFNYACNGQAIEKIEFHLCITADALSPYAKYLLEKVIITKHESIMNAGGLPAEILHLNYTKLHSTYIGHDEKNKPTTPMTTGFNLETGEIM